MIPKSPSNNFKKKKNVSDVADFEFLLKKGYWHLRFSNVHTYNIIAAIKKANAIINILKEQIILSGSLRRVGKRQPYNLELPKTFNGSETNF